jgi:hypothetical protein
MKPLNNTVFLSGLKKAIYDELYELFSTNAKYSMDGDEILEKLGLNKKIPFRYRVDQEIYQAVIKIFFRFGLTSPEIEEGLKLFFEEPNH